MMAERIREMIEVRPWTVAYIATVVTLVLVLQIAELIR